MKKKNVVVLALALMASLSCPQSRAVAFGFDPLKVDDVTLQKLNNIVQDGIKSLRETLADGPVAWQSTVTTATKCFFLAAIGAVIAAEGIYLIHRALSGPKEEIKEKKHPTADEFWRPLVQPTFAFGTGLTCVGLCLVLNSANLAARK